MKQDRLEPHPNRTFLRVKHVAIFGLFRLYDHDVPLHMEDRVTILHGPNGVGKTALLRLIAAAFGGRYAELTKVPFKKLDLELSDGSMITFEQTEKHEKREKRENRERIELGLKLSLKASGKTLHTYEFTFGSSYQRRTLARLASEVPSAIGSLDGDRWMDTNAGEELSTADAYNRFFGAYPREKHRAGPIAELEWFTELRTLVQVHLIETQRLIRMNPTDSVRPDRRGAIMVPTVRDCARDLQTQVTETLARYATVSQALDQSFPQRLLKVGGQPGLTTSDLKARMSGLNGKRAELQKIGLLDSVTSSPFDVESLDDLAPAQSDVMSLYVEDTQRKLAVLDDLSRRITILLGNVNGKFRNKSIQIHRDRGFVVIGPDAAPLEPDSLSSGEQHELVLLYDLLFRVRPGTLVLIDEPELSLHVGWQKKFLPDLLEIVRTAEFDALIATHSPFIVGDRSDLMVPLAADVDA